MSGGFKGLQINWVVIDKEAFAIVSLLQCLDYLLWDDVDTFTYHRSFEFRQYIHPVSMWSESVEGFLPAATWLVDIHGVAQVHS